MSKHRFFVPPSQISEGNVRIRGTDVWHITKVLRLSAGAEIIVFDGSGREYLVALEQHKRNEVRGVIRDQWQKPTESPLHTILAQGLPQANKMDLIVQKATEIGVNEIIPLETERSIWSSKHKRAQGANVAQRLDRWSRICIEAAKQSCRTAVPLIRPVVTIEEFLALPLSADLKLLLWEEEQQTSLRKALRGAGELVRAAVVIIGPEGGLTPEETAQFQEHHYQRISLGKRVLRTETAGFIVLGILQYEYGDYSF